VTTAGEVIGVDFMQYSGAIYEKRVYLNQIHQAMEELTLITPTFLFSAISLLLLAYTNRFLSYAQLVRTLKDKYLEDPDKVKAAQIDNLRKRLYITRSMQLLGISSLFSCVVTMFLIYVGFQLMAAYVFGLAILLLIASLGLSVWEIQISVKALELHLSDMKQPEKEQTKA